MDNEVLEETNDGVAVVTLNRPDSLNAMNPPMMRLLVQTLERLGGDPAVKCVVLTGAGKGFCSGGDTKASAKAASELNQSEKTGKRPARTFEERVAWLRRSVRASRLLHEMPKPTIAMINGACAGAGMSLAGACDLRLAGSAAVLVTAFVKGGLSGDYGGSWFWTRILGTGKARELFFLSEKIDAADALKLGMVNKVFSDDQLRDETMAIARKLAAIPGAAAQYLKANLNHAMEGSLPSLLDLEATHMILSRDALRRHEP